MTTSISIVSHGQLNLVNDLLNDLRPLYFDGIIEIILTINIPEDESVISDNIIIIDKIIRNKFSKGFGSNHNYAFKFSTKPYFLVINPDVRLNGLNLKVLTSFLLPISNGIIAPIVYSPKNTLEDSARFFPTLSNIAKRIIFKNKSPDYSYLKSTVIVDWVAGIFMLFKREVFIVANGFDERYFMYLEDADICRRVSNLGFSVVLCTNFSIIHNARRESHRNPRYLFWHLKSISRFIFLKR